ncbi:hypothetical protein [Gulosibacter chungangensis]|uniref:Uncharacterized protein n=1 Tax=Gulosibacter chungangensis TaxID=979746 RepID=A0A7J5B9D5_9MICO|nr:hypothetical protein [Gulosibacter chungangensis]KAB1642224.1 hypothetical protein F8O05_10385 [Gulosibacter chungangensis]
MNKILSLLTSKPSGASSRPIDRVMDTLRPAATPVRPALMRLGIGGFSAVHQFGRREMIHKLHRQDAPRFAPIGVVRILRKPLPPKIADGLFTAAQVTNALTTLGIAHRVTGPFNAALQLWTMTYRNSWGMIFHNDNGLVLHQAVLGLSRSADALSVDALVKFARSRAAQNRLGSQTRASSQPRPSSETRARIQPIPSIRPQPSTTLATLWKALAPERFDRHYGGIPTAMNIGTMAIYFISGIAKIRSPKGWGWASGDTLREQIASDAIRKEVFGSVAPKAAGALYNSKGQFGVLAIVTLIVELGAPLSLVNRRVGQLFALSAWAMHVGIRIVMGIKFKYNVSGVSYLPYFPVGRELAA